MINNGIISTGDNNTNVISNSESNNLINELEVLLKNNIETEIIKDAINQIKNNNKSKFIETLKKLSLETLNTIKDLSLSTLQKFIEKYILKF